MRIGDICSHSVVTCRRDTRVAEVAKMMRDRHVGAIVVVDSRTDQRPCPVGILTDRDLVVQVMAQGVNTDDLLAGDLIGGLLTRANERETVYDAVWHMRGHGVRRLPVVDEHDGLVGILAVDDVMRVLAEAMVDVSRTVPQQIEKERSVRSGHGRLEIPQQPSCPARQTGSCP